MKAQIDNEKCTGCGMCVPVCPLNAIQIKDGKSLVSDDCAGCGVCTLECPNEAISIEQHKPRLQKGSS